MNNKCLVFATNNPHKLKEARQILAEKIQVKSLSDIGCHDEIPETADTLQGNALIKARWVKEKYGYDCFADDTGLIVDALEGRPGVYSARYAGPNCSSSQNVAKLLSEMKLKKNRRAYFATVIALCCDDETIFEGRVEGSISEKPSGCSGFGYDPVFIPDGSSVSFAEMTPEAKNAISHRGRALTKLAKFLQTLVVLVFLTCCPFANAQQWRLHASYAGQTEEIVDSPNYVYFLGTKMLYNPENPIVSNLEGVLFKYDKSTGVCEALLADNGLSGNTVKAISYNYSKKYLAVALENGVINLLYDDGKIDNIFGLSQSDVALSKNVNDITFDASSNRVYLATDFGVVILNDRLKEIETSRVWNVPVRSAAVFHDRLWVSLDNGIFYGDFNSFSLSDLHQLPNIQSGWKLTPVGNDQLFFLYGNRKDIHIARIVESGRDVWPSSLFEGPLVSANRIDKGFIVSTSEVVATIGESLDKALFSLPPQYKGKNTTSNNSKDFWISCGMDGFTCLRAPMNDEGKWNVLSDIFFPNASTTFESTSMAYHPIYGMLVRNHGFEIPFSSRMINTNDLISGCKNGEWKPLSITFRYPQGLLTDNPWGIAIDPQNNNHVYSGSVRSGLLRLDLSDPSKSMLMGKATDFKGGQNKPGYVQVVPDNPLGTWSEQCVFAPPVFDSSSNLWTAYVNPVSGLDEEVSDHVELWFWTPSDRAASVNTQTFRNWNKIILRDIPTGNDPKILPLTSSAAKNIVLHFGNTVSTPLVFFDHNGTLDNLNDDKIVKLFSFYDQDGNSINISRVYSWFEDTSTGLVWLGYNDGIITINPQECISTQGGVKKIKVPRNDGTSLADYLLEGVQVNAITTDGKGNKWFSTQGAGLVCTTSDGRIILHSYTTDNSPIPGDIIYTTCFNPETSSLMISTDKGLCELFLSSSTMEDSSDIRVYPNPVQPNFFGFVTIDGLEEDSFVKIVDASGNLIKECGQVSGGIIMWNLTNNFSKRVSGGVYFILASGSPNSTSYKKVGKVLVIE